MEKKLILVLGGVRSGKSLFAEELARGFSDNVLYVATATADDDEMKRRIEIHQRRRLPTWDTMESPLKVGVSLKANRQHADIVLIDCLSVLISNILLEFGSHVGEELDAGGQVNEIWREEMDELLAAYRESSATYIIVSNEVGHGVVPPYPLGRIYRDVLGMANQYLAKEADDVYMLFAGIPVELKALSRMIGQSSAKEKL